MSRERLNYQILRVNDLRTEDHGEMYSLFERYYCDVAFPQFLTDLSEKDYVLVFRAKETGELGGFSTISCKRIPEVGRGTFLFSGDTVVAKKFWGSKILQTAFGVFLVKLRFSRPLEPIHWMLISKGFKTYMMMANNFGSSYPRFSKATPAKLEKVMNAYYTRKYGSFYDSKTHQVRFDHSHGAVKDGMADPLPSDLRNPHVDFFMKRNPDYRNGVELACLARVEFAELLFALGRAALKAIIPGSAPKPSMNIRSLPAKLLRAALHRAAHATHRKNHARFIEATRSLEKAQREVLARYLADLERPLRSVSAPVALTYEQFRERFPVTTFADWASPIEALRATRSIRFEPTSGSTSKRKWIPYPKALLAEFDAAASAWLHDLGTRYPGVLKGPHYWSLSWLPNDLRAEVDSTNDLQLFGGGLKRFAMDHVMAVPEAVGKLPTLERSKFASLVYLCANRDLSLISVWSPTFLLGLLDELAAQRSQIADVLESGHWETMGGLKAPLSPETANFLRDWDGKITPEFTARLWPKLALISAWDSGTSAHWAGRIKSLFPKVPFQGKGLWATEGCVTFPYQGKMPLAAHAHFYEFRRVDTSEIIPAWEVRQGMRLKPILTNASGLTRYEMQDIVRVTGFLNQTPCLEFEGRANTVDLAGEKIDAQIAQEILASVSEKFGITSLTLLARLSPPSSDGHPAKPYYTLLAEGNPELTLQVGKTAEQLLSEVHHYRLAREMGQLSEAQALVKEDALRWCNEVLNPDKKISGATKVESLALWTEN